MIAIKYKKNEKSKIKKINKMFNQMDTLLNELSPETQEQILNFHDEVYTLQHCIKWGLQASEDLLEK